MLGIFERLAEGAEMIGLAVEGAVVNAKCEIANAITDIEVEAKCRKYEREAEEHDRSKSIGEDDESILADERELFYKELLESLAQHEDATVRNPIDIAIELGYSEDDVKEAFKYLEEIINETGEGVVETVTKVNVCRNKKEAIFSAVKRPRRFIYDDNTGDDEE